MTSLTLQQPAHLLRLSDLTLLLVAMVWGTSYGVAKGALAFYPVLGFLALRFGLTFVLLLPTLLRATAQQRRDACAAGCRWGAGCWRFFCVKPLGWRTPRPATRPC